MVTLQVLCGSAKAEDVVFVVSNIVYDTIKQGNISFHYPYVGTYIVTRTQKK